MQQMIFIADLISCSTCFGHHYVHHQELESIIQVWFLPVVFDAWFSSCRYGVKLRVVCLVCGLLLCNSPQTGHIYTTGSNHLYNTLELLMMGIMVPKTCWASNKICNKNHLLYLVGILFPHINDNAQSKPHEIYIFHVTSI